MEIPSPSRSLIHSTFFYILIHNNFIIIYWCQLFIEDIMLYDSIVQGVPGNSQRGRTSSDMQCFGPPSLPDSSICSCPKNPLQVQGKAKPKTWFNVCIRVTLFWVLIVIHKSYYLAKQMASFTILKKVNFWIISISLQPESECFTSLKPTYSYWKKNYWYSIELDQNNFYFI
mgnify:FL=1